MIQSNAEEITVESCIKCWMDERFGLRENASQFVKIVVRQNVLNIKTEMVKFASTITSDEMALLS